VDEETRKAIRERDARPGDAEAAIAAARLVARSASREEAARAWQEALKRDTHAELPRQELASMGCDLFFAGKNERGFEEFESTVDGATLIRIPSGERRPEGATRAVLYDAFFVAKEPITYERFQKFLVKSSFVAKEEIDGWINLARGPLRRAALGSYKLHMGAASTFVHDVSWLGAAAYARWARGALPTEAQREIYTAGGYGVLDVATLGALDGEWLADLLGEMRIVAGPRGGHADARSFPNAGFRYVRASWWKA
jgi:formylglycine-generating enzyme required for sulfatase activity